MRWWMREKDGLVSGGWWVRVRGEYVDYIDWNKHICVDTHAVRRLGDPGGYLCSHV